MAVPIRQQWALKGQASRTSDTAECELSKTVNGSRRRRSGKVRVRSVVIDGGQIQLDWAPTKTALEELEVKKSKMQIYIAHHVTKPPNAHNNG